MNRRTVPVLSCMVDWFDLGLVFCCLFVFGCLFGRWFYEILRRRKTSERCVRGQPHTVSHSVSHCRYYHTAGIEQIYKNINQQH